jgi:uncharacterized protein (TIGR03792 family)
MVIEWLKFKISPNSRDKFLEEDNKIWTQALSKYPGFLSKEIWLNPEDDREIIFVIKWESYELLQAIPSEDLQIIDDAFSQGMGNTTYNLIEAKHYHEQ